MPGKRAPETEKSAARAAYVTQGLTTGEVARQFKRSTGTIERWRDAEGWEDARAEERARLDKETARKARWDANKYLKILRGYLTAVQNRFQHLLGKGDGSNLSLSADQCIELSGKIIKEANRIEGIGQPNSPQIAIIGDNQQIAILDKMSPEDLSQMRDRCKDEKKRLSSRNGGTKNV